MTEKMLKKLCCFISISTGALLVAEFEAISTLYLVIQAANDTQEAFNFPAVGRFYQITKVIFSSFYGFTCIFALLYIIGLKMV